MRTKILLSVFLLAVVVHPPLYAIIIETGAGKRVSGYVVREDKAKIVIRSKVAGKDRDDEYTLQNIRIIHRVSQERLAKLKKESPRDYRDYAEELAPKAEDPEARETALRLFLIAAWLEPDKLGRSCLMSMSNLARTPEEARRFRALAYLLDAKHDPAALQLPKQTGSTSAVTDKASEVAKTDFLSALKEFRRGRLAEARSLANQPGVAELFAASPGLMDHATFLAACKAEVCPTCKNKLITPCPTCKGKGQVKDGLGSMLCPDCNGKKVQKCSTCGGIRKGASLSDDQLRGILKAEYFWGEDKTDPKTMAPTAARWSALLSTQRAAPVPLLSLETVTEFDPRKCLYKGGKWVEP
jgi:hypothetical protein